MNSIAVRNLIDIFNLINNHEHRRENIYIVVDWNLFTSWLTSYAWKKKIYTSQLIMTNPTLSHSFMHCKILQDNNINTNKTKTKPPLTATNTFCIHFFSVSLSLYLYSFTPFSSHSASVLYHLHENTQNKGRRTQLSSKSLFFFWSKCETAKSVCILWMWRKMFKFKTLIQSRRTENVQPFSSLKFYPNVNNFFFLFENRKLEWSPRKATLCI